jgi:hypothetical protein
MPEFLTVQDAKDTKKWQRIFFWWVWPHYRRFPGWRLTAIGLF